MNVRQAKFAACVVVGEAFVVEAELIENRGLDVVDVDFVFDDVEAEMVGFFDAHRAEGTWPGGLHVELTGDDVTECMGGSDDVTDASLPDRYTTVCDPRLNARQSLDLAFRAAELLRR